MKAVRICRTGKKKVESIVDFYLSLTSISGTDCQPFDVSDRSRIDSTSCDVMILPYRQHCCMADLVTHITG